MLSFLPIIPYLDLDHIFWSLFPKHPVNLSFYTFYGCLTEENFLHPCELKKKKAEIILHSLARLTPSHSSIPQPWNVETSWRLLKDRSNFKLHRFLGIPIPQYGKNIFKSRWPEFHPHPRESRIDHWKVKISLSWNPFLPLQNFSLRIDRSFNQWCLQDNHQTYWEWDMLISHWNPWMINNIWGFRQAFQPISWCIHRSGCDAPELSLPTFFSTGPERNHPARSMESMKGDVCQTI